MVTEKRYKIFSKNKDVVLGQNIKLAENFIQRTIGLMFCEKMNKFDGLLIRPCNSIHTFFMKFKIDAIFMDEDFKIVKIYNQLAPWRMTTIHFKAHQVLELPPGIINNQLEESDVLEVLCINS